MGKKFGDIPRGIFIVRGENVVLLGEIVSGSVLVFFSVCRNYTNACLTRVDGDLGSRVK